MTSPEGLYFARARSGPGLWIVILVLIGAAAVWLWSDRREKPPGQARAIAAAEADSSGVISVPESAIVTGGDNNRLPGPVPVPVTPEVFTAPAPTFQNPSAVPMGNFLDYARQMQFDPSRGQDLQLPADSFGREPMIHLEPLAGLRRLDSLALSQGRILARMRSDVPFASLGLRSGDNFLWVRGTLGNTLPGELWTTSALASPRQILLAYSPRAPAEIPPGKDAWWIGDDARGRQLWIVCGKGWCHS
jgi:hypothetical protein